MKNILKDIRNRYRDWSDLRTEFKLSVLMQKEGSLPNKILKDEAKKLANLICIKWLENRGISHCLLCPENRSLHKIQSYYLCSKHYNDMEANKNGVNR
ncbi:MAG: hypothetical protein IPP74_13605 [Alphaproteobacteria bacterium]|nr:hypothetical protein [Alphaproteobacteria bacterium]